MSLITIQCDRITFERNFTSLQVFFLPTSLLLILKCTLQGLNVLDLHNFLGSSCSGAPSPGVALR